MARRFWDWSPEEQARLDFYRQFIEPGDTVFDVGANLGNRAKAFFKLGANVVAVEPQRECTKFLEAVFPRGTNFHLVRKALGASVGEAEMLVSNANTISSLAPSWIHAVKESGRFSDYEWNRSEKVSVDTLDNLLARYGRPSFVKIDVEGFEYEVICGLSRTVGALSLEFTPEYIQNTFKCIERLCRISVPRFQISLRESMQFLLPGWVSAHEIGRYLSDVEPSAFGELYVRYDA